MNILSLFGGIECGRVAVDRLGWKVDKYFSSEVDPYPIKVSSKNYPDIIHVGSVTDLRFNQKIGHLENNKGFFRDSRKLDLIIGGSPCQDLSIAKSGGKGLEGEKSGLFYEYVRILKEVKPKYFLLENVASMKQIDRDKITEVLREVYPDTEVHMINSSLVSAQNRKRLYWTNIKGITQPEDKGILLKDILDDIPMDDARWKPLDPKYLTPEFFKKIEKGTMGLVNIHPSGKGMNGIVINPDVKSPTLTTNKGEGMKVLGLAHRNRGEGKQPECNGTEKANSLTTVQSDSELLGVFQLPRGKNHGGIVQNGEKSPCVNSSEFQHNNFILSGKGSIKLGEINGGGQGNRIYGAHGKSASLGANSGGMAGASSNLLLGQFRRGGDLRVHADQNNSPCLTSNMGTGGKNVPILVNQEYYWRKLTPIECERLQTLPDNYTDCLSDSRRYKAIGNGWTVDVIVHILSFAKF